jgi:hydrogenase maturation protease
MKTLVIGYGNTMRSDDGAGVAIAEALDKELLEGVEVRTCQQLHVEFISEFSQYDRIILADTSVEGEEVDLRKIRPTSRDYMASSHHLGPELLLRLAEVTNLGQPELYLCMVRGKCFDYGEELSEEVAKRTREAVDKIKNLIIGEGVLNA